MRTFSWTKAVGFGVLLWLTSFAVISTLGSRYEVLWVQVALAVGAGIVAYIFSSFSEIDTAEHAVAYGVAWAVIGITLDLVVSRALAPTMFANWSYWLGYTLVLLAPWLQIETRSVSHSYA
jgi:hypothetical protein